MSKQVLRFLFALTSFAALANAQAYNCAATSTPQPLRAEALTDYIADVLVTCTGGSFSSSTPQNVTITLNANITSTTIPDVGSEATLLTDDATPGNRSIGFNIFHGDFQGSSNSITFEGVPVFPPGPSGTRTYRFTNIRVNASTLAPGATVLALVSTQGSFGLPVSAVTAGVVQASQAFDVRACDDSQPSFITYQQGTSQNPALALGSSSDGFFRWNVRFRGNFVGAYRRSITPGQDPSNAGTKYNAESNFVDTESIGNTAGFATQGTRLLSRFNNVPAGVRLFVTTRPVAPGIASSTTVNASLVSVDANGAGPTNLVGASGAGTCALGNISQFIAEIPVNNGSAQAVWEVTSSDPNAAEKVSFGVVVAYASAPPFPGLGTVNAIGRLGPLSTVALPVDPSTAPAPRFAATAPGITVPAFAIATAGNTNPLSITTSTPLPSATVGVPYSLPSFTAAGGTPAYSFSSPPTPPSSTDPPGTPPAVIPPGFTLLNNGAFTGLPTAAGSFTFTIQVTDQAGGLATKLFNLVVFPANTPTITTATPLPAGTVATLYTPVQFAASGFGSGSAISWSIVGINVLPVPGLSFSSTGVLSGTPATAGTYSFTVQASAVPPSNVSGGLIVATKLFSITINPQPTVTITIIPTVLPAGLVGSPYSQLLTASGGTGPYTFAISSGALPSGLNLSSAGLVSGTLLSAGSSSVVIVATDSLSHTGSQGYSVTVTTPTVIPPDDNGVTITTRLLPNGVVGADYTPVLNAAGGTLPYSWSADTQSLPPGVTLNPNTGAFSGKPTRAGNFRISVRVTDAKGGSDGTVFPITITGPPLSITTTTLTNAALGVAYSASVQATGGIPPYTFSISGGSLPAGLTFGSDGTIRGTPTAAGASTFTVQVVDAALSPQGKDTRSFTITVTSTPPVITTTSLANGVVKIAYSGSVAASGGVPPYTFAVSSGALPDGLSLSADGNITGTPGTLGDFNVTIQVTDKVGQKATKAFPIKIVAAPSITTNSPLPIQVTGTASSLTLAATGGTLPYTWSVTGGSLPGGLSLDSGSGAITGTPNAVGPYTFTATVTDANKLTAAKAFTGKVSAPVRITTAPALPAATVGTAVSQQIAATGGTTPYRFTGDGLPAGLSIDTAGLITGSPTAVSNAAFNVTVTDTDGLTATTRFTLAISLPQVSGVTIGGVTDTPPAAQQQRVTLTLGSTFPVAITGTVALTFASDATVPADDPSIQFSTGGRSASFTVPAGSTTGTFTDPNIAIQTGTVSGTITLTTSLQSAAGAVTCNCALTRTIRVAKGVPVITPPITAVRGAGAITITIIGFSTTRELTQAAFQFTTAAGSNVSTTSFTVPIATSATSWYQSTASNQFGGQFKLTLPFTVQGDVNAITNVSVTLSNTQGASTAVSATVQ